MLTVSLMVVRWKVAVSYFLKLHFLDISLLRITTVTEIKSSAKLLFLEY